jgi:hypothetical protein
MRHTVFIVTSWATVKPIHYRADDLDAATRHTLHFVVFMNIDVSGRPHYVKPLSWHHQGPFR